MSETNEPKDCPHCKGLISIRMPVPSSGCDHLYYPENCPTCQNWKDAPAKKELEMCPFCGSTKIKFNHAPDSLFSCVNCGADGPMSTDAKSHWNNAYCWKELAKAKEELTELRAWKEGKKGIEDYYVIKEALAKSKKKLKEAVNLGSDQAARFDQEIFGYGMKIKILCERISALESQLSAKEKEIAMLKESMLSQDRTHPWIKISTLEARVKVLTKALEYIRHIPDIPEFDSSPIEQVDAMCDTAEEALSEIKE